MPNHDRRRTTRRLALAIAALTCAVLAPAGTASAETLVDTGTEWFDNQAFSSGYFAFGFTATSAAQVDGVSFFVHGTTSSEVSGSSVDIYRDHPTAPTNPANLVGTLTYASIDAEGDGLRVSFTGSVTVPAAGAYWLKWRDLTAGQDVWIRMGPPGTPAPWTFATGTWYRDSVEQSGPGGLTDGYFPKFRITGGPVSAPAIEAVTPAQGPAGGGTSVVITGTGLGSATAVAFGDTAAASFTIDSPTQITAVAPAHAAGAVDVTVTGPGGTATLPAAFRYEAAATPATTPVATATTGAPPDRGPRVLRAGMRPGPDGSPVTSGRVPQGATRVEQAAAPMMPAAKRPPRGPNRVRTIACPITTSAGVRTFRCAPTLSPGRWRLTTRAMARSTVIAQQVRVVRVARVPTADAETVTG